MFVARRALIVALLMLCLALVACSDSNVATIPPPTQRAAGPASPSAPRAEPTAVVTLSATSTPTQTVSATGTPSPDGTPIRIFMPWVPSSR